MTEPVSRLMQDWITLWQSELAALAVDREAQEGWQQLVGLWAEAARGWVSLLPQPAHEPARPAAPPRPAAAAAAPDAGDAALARLAERIAELERRLAEREP